MFANPIWSVLLLVGVFALYWFVIRPKAPILEVGKEIKGFWARWTERIIRYRSYVAGLVGALLVALPDLLVAVAPFDFSPFIGPEWAKKVGSVLALFLLVNTAFKTKPGNEKP